MSASNENSVPASTHDSSHTPAAAPHTTEDHAADAPTRPQKTVLLPEIVRLSLEGHSSRTIGRKLGVARQTIDRWLREQRQQWAEHAAKNAAEIFLVAAARHESVYREAMEAWRRSLADKQVTVEKPGEDGAAGAKATLRKTTQSGQAALLGKAIEAANEISKFNEKHLQAVHRAAATERRRARRGLADELQGLSKWAFQGLKELVRQAGDETPRRSPQELADDLAGLTATEYHKLRALLWSSYERQLPLRRADPRYPETEGDDENAPEDEEEAEG